MTTTSEPTPLWKAHIKRRSGKNGEPETVPTIDAAATILHNDSDFAGCFVYDKLASQIRVERPLPKLHGYETIPPPGPITDIHIDYTAIALQRLATLTLGAEPLTRAIGIAAAQRSKNPLTDYLEGLRWDATPRLDTWLTRYLGADPSQGEHVSSVGRWWLISAIARAFRPGVQADYMLVLEGGQGAGKTQAIATLGGEFTLRRLPALRDYERAAASLQGRWLVEIAELDAFRGAAATQIKDFLSLPIDQFRAAYARFDAVRPRSCVFVGTTNEEHYLRDATGARRYWPVRVGTIDLGALARDRDQLLAEAVVAYQAGAAYQDRERPPETRWWPPTDEASADLRAALADSQEERQEASVDPWAPVVAAWVEGYNVEGARVGQPRDGLTTGDVLIGALDMRRGDWGREEESRVGVILRRLRMDTRRCTENGVRVRRYWRVVDH